MVSEPGCLVRVEERFWLPEGPKGEENLQFNLVNSCKDCFDKQSFNSLMKNFPSIKKTVEFRRVYKRGVVHSYGVLVMYVYANSLSINRIGISASRKNGNSVERHRFYRRIREIFRKYDSGVKKGNDIVIIARKHALHTRFFWLEKDYMSLIKLHGL